MPDDLNRRKSNGILRREEDHNIWRLSGPTSEQPSPPMPFIASTRDDREPQYSPDGSRIAFASDRSGNREVWICDSDGSNPFQLTFLGHSMGHDWSADQRRITFHAVERANDPSGGKLGEIFIVDAHGGIPRNITHDEFGDGHPSWSATNAGSTSTRGGPVTGRYGRSPSPRAAPFSSHERVAETNGNRRRSRFLLLRDQSL